MRPSGNPDEPKGCYLKKGGRIYWNEHVTGKGCRTCQEICLKTGKYIPSYVIFLLSGIMILCVCVIILTIYRQCGNLIIGHLDAQSS